MLDHNNLTAQAIFDHVVVGLALQGGRSVARAGEERPFDQTFGVGTCAYRGENGRKCGVGFLLTDDEVWCIGNHNPIATGPYDELVSTAPVRFAPFAKLLSDIQSVHDTCAVENLNTGNFIDIWHSAGGIGIALEIVADDHRLSKAVLYTAFPNPDAVEQKTASRREPQSEGTGIIQPLMESADPDKWSKWWNSLAGAQ